VFYALQRRFPHVDRNYSMKVRSTFFAAVALLLVLPAFAPAEAFFQQSAPPASGAPEQPTPPPTTQTTLPPQSAPPGSAPLRVMVDKSLLINTTERIKRISVTDPSIADPQVLTSTQILVHGRAPGEVSLIIWDELERSRSFDLRVDVDVTACAEEEHRVFPDEQISVTPSRAAIVLSGHVTTEDVAKRAGELASAYSKNVINVLTFGPVGAQEVLLEVKFAEVDRSSLTQLGINVFSTGAGNLIGTSTTGQYGGFAPQSITQTQGVSAPVTATESISSVLNMFLFAPNVNLGAVIEALQTKNLLQILSEPTLIAVNGKKASFLAGGQFPFPIVQPGAGFTAVTISFKEFGVKLDFTPVIMPNGNIHLTVDPEVSTLDFADALTISGFTIPALSTRKAETEFELQDGQSFVIAGLIDNRVTDTWNKVPGLGDIPILGAFFRSKSISKSNSELMVLCTVHRVSPNTATPAGPKNPDTFINNDKFDAKKPLWK
jgi:pilus assembly protein CpaC